MENEWVARAVLSVVLLGTGILLMWLARAAASGRLKRNSVAGIRTADTLASDEAWSAAHARAEGPSRCAGAVGVATGVLVLVPVPMPVVMIGVLVAAAVILTFTLYGTVVGGKAARAVTDGEV